VASAEPPRLPHLTPTGEARMVDVSDKQVTARTATARARVLLSAACVAALRDQTVPKGDALAVARIAGLQGAKRTSELIPLCHPLFLSGVDVSAVVDDTGVALEATVRTTERTGVEMEALTAVTVAGLTVIDMIKAIDRAAVITDVMVVHKSGGRSGEWHRE
jgi:cyclic pyranopterin phosphate synthase